MGNPTTRRLPSVGALLISMALGCGGATTTEQPSEVATAEPAPPPPTFTSTRVLTGADGVRVELAEFGEDDAYVRITGIRSPVAGIVFDATIRDNGRRLEYITTRDGSDYYPIHKEALSDGTTRWTLYAPGLREGVRLEWDEDASAALDAAALHASHYEQRSDGTLERIQTFDRAAAVARNEEVIARDLQRTEQDCGAVPEWSFDWESVSDEVLKEKSVASYCGNLLQAFRNLCRWDPAKELVGSIERVQCAWIDEGSELSLADGSLRWAVASDLTNGHDVAREKLEQLRTANGDTLAEALAYARSSVCRSPDDEHVVIVHPHRQDGKMGISYGTPSEVFYAPQPEAVGRGWFFDPRQRNEQHNQSFRGYDLRFYSHVDVDDEADTCTLTCGERATNWTLLPATEAREVIKNAESKPSPFDREPYALARDRRGTYYYVDRGNTPETRRDFRVYRGRRGNMERLEMRDIVSDSEGEIFATASGSLRLQVDTGDGAHWIERERPKELRRVPIEDNYRLIMEELGVYLGERFELPCDDY